MAFNPDDYLASKNDSGFNPDAYLAQQREKPSMFSNIVQGAKNIVSDIPQDVGNLTAGAVRGAAGIGATLLTPIDYAAQKLGIQNSYIGRDDRRQASTQALREMGAQTESLPFKTGEVGSEIAGTAGVGGLLGKGLMVGARFAPTVVPKIAAALESGGFSTGAAPGVSIGEKLANAGIRVGGGAASGAAMGGLINPDDITTGAVIGGAIPVVGKIAGESGALLKQFAIDPLFRPQKAAMDKLIQDAGGIDQAQAAIQRAIAAGKTLSGESYTLGQAGKNAGIAATERARAAVNPENFQSIYQAQRDARLKALQGIGQDETAVQDAIASRAANARANYGAIQDQPIIGGEDLNALLNRARAGGALTEAQKIAQTEGRKFSIPVVEQPQTAAFGSAEDAAKAAYGGMPEAIVPKNEVAFGTNAAPTDNGKLLLTQIRNMGGISMKDAADLMGEKQITNMGVQGGVFTTKGAEVGDVVRKLVDKGWFSPNVLKDADGGAQYLRDAIQKAAGGGADDMAQRAAQEAYFGIQPKTPLSAMEQYGKPAAPQSALEDVVGQAIKTGDLHSVKMGIDQAIGASEGHQKAALMQLKNDFLDWMGKQSPDYLAANAQYAAESKPINQMKVAQKLTDALTGEASKYGANASQNAASFFRALKNAPSIAKTETGMRQNLSQIFTPDQLGTIKQVGGELAKDVDLQNLGRGIGSDTAQKLARSNLLSDIANIANTSPVGRSVANVISLGAKGRVNSQLDALLQSPEYAGKTISDLTNPQKNRLVELMRGNGALLRAAPIAIQSR
jgi:hypothetical protein